MAHATIAGYRVLDAKITMALRGAWRIDAVCDAQETISGRQSLTCGDAVFSGHIDEFDLYADTAQIVLTSGAGATQTTLGPAAWRQATIRTILNHTLRSAGETLSNTSNSHTVTWPYYARMRCTFGAALNKIASLAGANWRYLADGTVFFGAESWPVATETYQVLTRDPRIGEFTIVSETLFARPGMVIDNRQVKAVTHRLMSGEVRSILSYEVAP